jgi:hypothetical protein
MWHGHPVWGTPGKQPICLLKANRSYITVGLWRGQDITDPSRRLKAGARRMAPVKLTSTKTSTRRCPPTGCVRPRLGAAMTGFQDPDHNTVELRWPAELTTVAQSTCLGYATPSPAAG